MGHKLLLSPKWLRATLEQTEVHCLLLLRDPRDAALSYFHRTGMGVERYLRNWCDTVRTWQEFRSHERLLALRFEDLLSAPEQTLARLGAWLGQELDARPAQLRFQRSRAHGTVAWHENSAFGDVSERFDGRSLARWRSHESAPIVRYASWVSEPYLDALGYERGSLGVPPADRLRFACLGVLDAGEHRAYTALGGTVRWLRQRLLLQKSGWVP